jgi:hypothetical protein
MEPHPRADGTCHFNKSSRILFAAFLGVKRICYVRSVIATVPVVPEGVVSRTTWREWQGCAPGGAGPATRAFSPGRLPSDMSGTCIAECAAIWTCSVFRANMGWACSPGCFACFAFLLIAVPRAGIAFSHFGFTAASYPRSIPWNQGRSLIPSRTSVAFPSGAYRKPKVDFHYAERMITKGDGVRLLTAVLLAGQMMTPDKFLVAESCPRQ